MIGKYDQNFPAPAPSVTFWQGVQFNLITDGHTPFFRATIRETDFERIFLSNPANVGGGSKLAFDLARGEFQAQIYGIHWSRVKNFKQWIGSMDIPAYEAMRVLNLVSKKRGNFAAPAGPWD